MAAKQKILITEEISDKAIDFLKTDFEVDIKKQIPKSELRDIIKNYDALIIKNKTKVTSEVINNTDRLKVIGKVGANIDNIDIKSATLKGIYVINAPFSHIVSTAELTIAFIFSLAKRLNFVSQITKTENMEDKQKLKGVELEGKTLSILGLGQIGSLVAKKALSLGVNVVAYDPYVSDDKFWQLGIKKAVNLYDAFKDSDFVSIHLPKTKETIGLVNKEVIKDMKKGSFLINMSKSGVVVEEDLYEFIKNGHLSGAAIDFFEIDQMKNSKLFGIEEVICTPRMRGSTIEALRKSSIEIAEQIKKVLEDEIPTNVVNLPSYTQEIIDASKPFIELCNDLGSLFSQLFEHKVEELEISYVGKVANLKTEFLTSIILIKILERESKQRINLVNLNLICEERGLKVNEIKNPTPQDYLNLISLKGRGENFELSVSGTITGIKNNPLFIGIDKFEINMVPSKYMAFISYKDIPGQIGKIGTAFGELGVNIAAMHVGRKTIGGEALMGLNLDCEVNDEMLEEFKKKSGFSKIKIINL
jgi:D-3-phosphoglycerate dehydrogenase